MNESPASSDAKKPNLRATHGLIVVAVVVAVAAGAWWLMRLSKNAAEANAIEQIRALNKREVDAGGQPPVVMQIDQQKHVATIIVQQNLQEVVPLLADLHRVTEVYLAGTDFGDEDVAVLKRLPKLTSLVLSNTKITDAGVSELAGMQLHSLHLKGTSISPAAVEVLGAVKGLQVLNLSQTNAYQNLAPLANLKELEWLLLNDCDLGSAGEQAVDALGKIPNLGRLTVHNANLSSAMIDQLRAAKPGLNLEAGGSGGESGDDGSGDDGSSDGGLTDASD